MDAEAAGRESSGESHLEAIAWRSKSAAPEPSLRAMIGMRSSRCKRDEVGTRGDDGQARAVCSGRETPPKRQDRGCGRRLETSIRLDRFLFDQKKTMRCICTRMVTSRRTDMKDRRQERRQREEEEEAGKERAADVTSSSRGLGDGEAKMWPNDGARDDLLVGSKTRKRPAGRGGRLQRDSPVFSLAL